MNFNPIHGPRKRTHRLENLIVKHLRLRPPDINRDRVPRRRFRERHHAAVRLPAGVRPDTYAKAFVTAGRVGDRSAVVRWRVLCRVVGRHGGHCECSKADARWSKGRPLAPTRDMLNAQDPPSFGA